MRKFVLCFTTALLERRCLEVRKIECSTDTKIDEIEKRDLKSFLAATDLGVKDQ